MCLDVVCVEGGFSQIQSHIMFIGLRSVQSINNIILKSHDIRKSTEFEVTQTKKLEIKTLL